MLALRIILQVFSIKIPSVGMRISISWLPIYVVGFFFGPIIGIFFGAIADTTVWLLNGGVWFWMYAIQEPIIGFISGIFSGIFFLTKKCKAIWYMILWRILVYGFIIGSILIIGLNYSLISNGSYMGSKSMNHELIFFSIISILLVIFVIILEFMNYHFYKKKRNKQISNDNYRLFIYVSMINILCIVLFSFILGPISQMELWKYLGRKPPTNFLKYGIMYLLIPRILKEAIKTPIYIVILFSLIYSLKYQFKNILNVTRNNWNSVEFNK